MIVSYGIDIGATSIKGAAVDRDGRELASFTIDTPVTSSAELEDAIVACFDRIHSAFPGGVSVGLGAPGWVDSDRKIVHYSPNLPWRDESLADRISARINLPVVVENDANAAAWAEYRFGAGRGASQMVAITLGSGVGGALIIEGNLIRGHQGLAGELGHCPATTDGYPCVCGRKGCLENYASGRALARRSVFDGTGSLMDAAARGDQTALAEYRRMGADLGRALASTVLVLNPEVVVICGAVADAFNYFAPSIKESLRENLGSWSQSCPRIVPAQLGQTAGRIGAASLALV